MITGPGSPSVLSNMAVSIEQHVEWISDCLEELRRSGFDTIEPTDTAEAGWVKHNNEFADLTLMPSANSWYMGANVPGKPRVFLPYVGGVDTYRTICNEVVERGYLGFALGRAAASQVNDGVVRQLKPDVGMMVQMMASLGLPRSSRCRRTMRERSWPRPAPRTRQDRRSARSSTGYSPALPAICPTGCIARRPTGRTRSSRTSTVAVGCSATSIPTMRCVVTSVSESDAIIVSVDYRHAPEDRFPAAADDGFAAVQWIAANAEELGGIPGRLAVCGWSAGANVAAVAAQSARDAGGPALAGQVLLTPVTDSDQTRDSYVRNGEGFVLTAA